MALIEIKKDPTRTELLVFAGLWTLFFFVLGRMAMWKPEALLIAAAFTGLCWLVSFLFCRDIPRRHQLMGLLIPGSLLAIGGVERLGVPAHVVEYTLWGVAAVGGGAAAGVPALARVLYTGWMRAAVPIGWTVSHILMGLIYSAILTPIGLALRLRGHDPLDLKAGGDRASFWNVREPPPTLERYFRQF